MVSVQVTQTKMSKSKTTSIHSCLFLWGGDLGGIPFDRIQLQVNLRCLRIWRHVRGIGSDPGRPERFEVLRWMFAKSISLPSQWTHTTFFPWWLSLFTGGPKRVPFLGWSLAKGISHRSETLGFDDLSGFRPSAVIARVRMDCIYDEPRIPGGAQL